MQANGQWRLGVLAAAVAAAWVQMAAGQAAGQMAGQAAGGEVAVAAPVRIQLAPKDRNGAIKYLGLFSQLTKSGAAAGLDWDAIGANLDPAKMPAEYREAVKVVDPAQIRMMREAAALENCDFENHYEDGWAMLLPALGNFRQCVRLLRVDTREAMIAGDFDRATDNLVAGYRMVRHVTRDPIMICSLVGTAMAEHMFHETQVLIHAPGVTREQKQRLSDAIRAMGSDPFNIRASIEGERSMSLTWLRRKLIESDDAGRAKIFADTGIAGGVASESPEYVLLMNMGRDELIAMIDMSEPMYRDTAEAWDAPNASERLKAIAGKIESGGYGIFAQLFGPALNKAHTASTLGEQHLRELVAALESKPVKNERPVGVASEPAAFKSK